MATIDIDKIEKSDAEQVVKDIYKRVKRDLIDCKPRKSWLKMRERNWNAAYPLDPEEDEAIWTQEEREAMISKGQIPLAINDLAKGVQCSCAVITSKNPGMQFLPVGTGDLYVTELLRRAWDYVLNCNDGTLSIYDVAKEWKVSGLAGWEIKHDQSRGVFGKVCIEELDVESYYFDTSAKRRDHTDVSFGKAHLITKEEAKENYDIGDEDLIFNEMRPDESPDGMEDTKIGKDNYDGEGTTDAPEDKEEEPNVWEIEDWEIKKAKVIRVMIPDAQEAFGYITKDFKTYKEAEEAGWTLSPDKEQAIDAAGVTAAVVKFTVSQRIQRIIVGKKVVSEKINPLGVDSDGDPVLSISVIQHDRTLRGYPTCPVTRAMELTRSRNKRRMQSIYVVTKNIDAPIYRSAGTKWVKDDVHGDELEVAKDSPFAPARLLPGTTSAELVNMEQIDKQDINAEFDVNDVLKGNIPQGQSNIAGRTVLALQDMVGVINNPSAQTFENGLLRTAKAIVFLTLKTWRDQQMWKRLIEADEMQTWQPDKEVQMDDQGRPVQPEPDVIAQKWQAAIELLRPSDPSKESGIKLIDLDIKMLPGSTQPTNRMAKTGVALEMKREGVYDAEAVLEYIDDPMKDKVIDRASKRSQQVEADKVTFSIAFKDLPPEAQAQLLQQKGIKMNSEESGMTGGIEQ